MSDMSTAYMTETFLWLEHVRSHQRLLWSCPFSVISVSPV